MASKLKQFWLQLPIISFSLLLMTTVRANEEPQVPCYFIFGDSLSDDGNNNNLVTLAKANYPPYGVDFPGGSTGRFCNGPNVQDFIVKLLGFKDYIPPFTRATGESILKGVNYAAGAAGIRDESGQRLGMRIPLNQQLRNHKSIISRIRRKLGDSSANKLLSQCIYSLQIGNNDYINNYFQPEYYNTSRQYTLEQYAVVLVDQQYSQQIKSLYDDGARKFAINGLSLIGCTPYSIETYGTNGSLCVDKLNDAATLFNERLEPLVQEFNANLTNATFTYLNPSPSALDIALAGITNLRESCCKTGGGEGELCIRNSKPCNNRNQYLFWDGLHPTAAYDNLTARVAYESLSPTDAFPFNIKNLAKQ